MNTHELWCLTWRFFWWKQSLAATRKSCVAARMLLGMVSWYFRGLATIRKKLCRLKEADTLANGVFGWEVPAKGVHWMTSKVFMLIRSDPIILNQLIQSNLMDDWISSVPSIGCICWLSVGRILSISDLLKSLFRLIFIKKIYIILIIEILITYPNNINI